MRDSVGPVQASDCGGDGIARHNLFGQWKPRSATQGEAIGIIAIATILIAVLVLVALLAFGFSNFKRKR
jgi:hypothetical protein